MGTRGGKREGAGRKRGSLNKQIDEIRGLLEDDKEKLIKKAVKMALDGNAVIMNKLLDKLLPNLNSIDFGEGEVNFPEIVINVVSNKRSD